MAFLFFMPALAWAGGDVDLDGVITGKGLNSDHTVDAETMVLVYMKDLDAKYGEDFSNLYSLGKVDAGFKVGEDAGKGTYNTDSGGYWAYYIWPEDVGKDISFWTETKDGDTHYNNSTGTFKVVKAKTALTKPSLSVTKISKKKAGLRWSAVTGATAYEVYCNGKLVKKTGASTTTYIHSKKGAGKGKYKVIPVGKSGGTDYKGPASDTKKGQKNQKTYSVNKSIKSVTYGTAPFRISRISLTGKTYKVTGYVVNNRIFRMLRYKKLTIKIYCNGKLVAKKTFKKLKKANCKASGVKKVNLTIKGKGGVDFHNAQGTTWKSIPKPYWEVVGGKGF